MNDSRFIQSHTRPFSVPDVLSDAGESSTIDLGILVETDPKVILAEDVLARSDDWRAVKNEFHNDPVAGETSAMGNNQVYPLSTRYSGSIMNLFQLGMVSEQLYPERLGEWLGYDGGLYLDFSEEEQLFNREQVANITDSDS